MPVGVKVNIPLEEDSLGGETWDLCEFFQTGVERAAEYLTKILHERSKTLGGFPAAKGTWIGPTILFLFRFISCSLGLAAPAAAKAQPCNFSLPVGCASLPRLSSYFLSIREVPGREQGYC